MSFKNVYNLIFVFHLICATTYTSRKRCVINTETGRVRGYRYDTTNESAYIYKNIPYAKQPVGNLRFELPVKIEKWSHKMNKENEEIFCPQLMSSSSGNTSVIGREDCLVLDIYMKKTRSSDLSVLVYFHPGKFSQGSKKYNLDLFLDLEDTIVVRPNYRLGILGFLSTGDAAIPGNMGLWDQRMAMKWVYENILYFGGNPERITIAGHEAGAQSVGFHVLSPLSHSYFTSAISSGGSALDPRAMNENHQQARDIVLRRLDCVRETSMEEIRCLKSKDIRHILESQLQVKFLPIVDNEAKNSFLPFEPQILYTKGYQKNASYMLGAREKAAYKEVKNNFSTAIKTEHLDKIIQYFLAPYMGKEPNFELIASAVKYHYLGKIPIITSFEEIEPIIVDMMSDFLYTNPMHITAKLHSVNSENTYLYILNYDDQPDDIYEYIQKGQDMEELKDNLLELKAEESFEPISANTDYNLKQTLCKIWELFIKFSYPPRQSDWKRFSEDNQNYVEVSRKLHAKTHYRNHDLEFWEYLVPMLKNIGPALINNTYPTVLGEMTYISENITEFIWGAVGLSVLLGVICIALVGVVMVAAREFLHSSIIPISALKEDYQYRMI